MSACANTSNHCYLTHELRLRLKEEALGVCPNYLLQHCHPQHLPLHQHHLLRRRPRRRRSLLEQLPRGARRAVAGRSLKSSKLKQWTFLSFFSASVIYCLYFCVVVWIWVCGVMCLLLIPAGVVPRHICGVDRPKPVSAYYSCYCCCCRPVLLLAACWRAPNRAAAGSQLCTLFLARLLCARAVP